MKKFALITVLLFAGCLALFAKPKTQTVKIDELYSIEWILDSDTNKLELNLYSDNSAPLDEEYAFDCIKSELDTIINENGYTDYIERQNEKTRSEKYTILSYYYTLQ